MKELVFQEIQKNIKMLRAVPPVWRRRSKILHIVPRVPGQQARAVVATKGSSGAGMTKETIQQLTEKWKKWKGWENNINIVIKRETKLSNDELK
jgi:hypothetical protein